MSETCVVCSSGERGERPTVEVGRANRVDRLLDDLTGEVVPEDHGPVRSLESAGCEAFVQLGRRSSEHCLENRQLRPRPDDGGRLQHVLRLRAEARHPREDRVTDAVRNPVAAGGEHLGDEERIAVRQAMKLDGIEVGARRERSHALHGQRLDQDPPTGVHVAQEDPQRMAGADLVVPVGGEKERGSAVDASSEVEQQVERASSAQCTSSTTTSVGSEVSAASVRAKTSARDPPGSRPRSCSGASGCGVNSPSHAARRTRTSPSACSSANRRTSDVLPTPASPPRPRAYHCPLRAAAR